MKRIIGLIRQYPRASAGIFLFFLLAYWFCLPRPLFDKPHSFVLESEDGTLLGARIAADGQWRFPPVDSVPEKFATAIIAFEDKRFYRHPGVDPASLLRALRQNIRNRRIVSGGSTISMQVIRMARDNPPRTIFRKVLEMVQATRLELGFSKREILCYYASNAPFGGNVVGLEAAAWRYYGKPPNLLSWGEAAMLAVLPNSPALIHPGRNRTALENKRNRLLNKLMEAGVLDTLSCQLALEEPLPQAPHPLPDLAPHLLARAQQEQSAARIRTTLDIHLQSQLNNTLALHQRRLRHNEIHNLAAFIMEVESGEVVAYAGNVVGAGASHAEAVDVITAPRSTGSILKPFLFARAVQEGEIFPQSLLRDVPTQLGGYRPENFNEDYDGLVSAERALIRSLNVPMIQLLSDYGLEKFHHHLKDIGLSTIHQPATHYGLPLVLGGAEGSLWELTNAYACMARMLRHHYDYDGLYNPQDFREAVYTELPTDEMQPSLQKQPEAFSAGAVWQTFQAMQQVERPNTEGEWQHFDSSRRIAWKTGTSFGFRDAWAIGLNPRYAVGVWAGNADGEGRPGLIGIQAAAPVLFDLFNLLQGGDEWFEQPYDDMQRLASCALSGYRASPYCPADTIWATANGDKVKACTYHQLVHLDHTRQWQVNASCESVRSIVSVPFFVLPPLEEFYYRRRYPNYQPLPPLRPDCYEGAPRANMQLIYPKDFSQIYVPVGLDGKLSKTVFKAAHRRPGIAIHWHIDDQFLLTTRDFHSIEIVPPVGKHLLTLVDEHGGRLEQAFEIIGK